MIEFARVALAAVSLIAAGCVQIFPFDAVATQDLTIQVGEATTLKCRTHNGHVRVDPAGDSDFGVVQVHAKKTGHGETQTMADQSLAAIVISHEVVDGEVRVGWSWREDKHEDWRATVSFDIEAPEGFATSLVTHNGAIVVKGLQGAVAARTHNGAIATETTSPSLALRTHNGAIKVSGRANEVALRTHNGSIGGALNGEGAVSGSIQTHNGNVEVELGSECSARFEVKVHRGAIHLEGARVQDQSEHQRKGWFGDEQVSKTATPLTVRTHNGGVALRSKSTG